MKNYKPRIPHKIYIVLLLLSLLLSSSYLYSVSAQDSNGSEHSFVDHQIVLMFQPGIMESQKLELIRSIVPNYEILDHEDDFILIEIGKNDSVNGCIDKFKASDLIYSAEPNYIISPMSVTNDAYIDFQWSIKNTGSYRSFEDSIVRKRSSTAGVDLNLAKTWEFYNTKDHGTQEVIVAIIDTGIDITHEDLRKNIWRNNQEIIGDGIDNDGNGYVDDINGWDFYNNDNSVYQHVYDRESHGYVADPHDNDDHGTHIAGIIGATSNNKVGIAGVASNINVKLMPLKIEGGKDGSGTISNAIKAIKYATKMGAKVCNISWGSSVYSQSLKLAIKESNMLFICAAGNSGTNNNYAPVYPASYKLSNVISVTFIDADGDLCRLSNYGSSTVDIAAPGYDILSTTVGNTYTSMSGSSMAVPHVTGIAAMLYAHESHMYPSNVKNIILKNYKKLSGLKNKIRTPGIPNALSAVTSLSSIKTDKQAPSISLKTSYQKDQIKVSLSTSDSESKIRVIKYAFGKQSLSYFEKGTEGISITKKYVLLSKSGLYTFYISDYAGNQRIVTYNVKNDVTPPTIYTTTLKSSSKTYVKITAKDSESGVHQVKYLKGKHSLYDFKAPGSGTTLKASGSTYSFSTKSKGYYTIYAIDYRGNKMIHHIYVYG